MSDKEAKSSDYLMNTREGGAKPFAASSGDLVGKSAQEAYMADLDFKAAHDLHKQCRIYATAYTAHGASITIACSIGCNAVSPVVALGHMCLL